MVTLREGKTVKVYVPKDKKQEIARWIDNFRRYRETLEEISTLNRQFLKAGRLFESDWVSKQGLPSARKSEKEPRRPVGRKG